MILVTVGTEQPFDRLIQAVDAWALENNRHDVFAQIGEGGWQPKFINFEYMLQPKEFAARFSQASLIVSHAGMGTILMALMHRKPILVMPKRASLGEHRSEHQSATARKIGVLTAVNVAWSETELRKLLDQPERMKAPTQGQMVAGDVLTGKLREFIMNREKII